MQGQEPGKAAKYLRVKVADHTKEGRPAVNIKVPIGVAKWGMKMAQAVSPQMKDVNLDWNSIEVLIGKSSDQTRSCWWNGRRIRRALLSAGIASAVVYVVGDVTSGLRYDGYSFRNQAISELSAFGSPARSEMVTVILVHGVLLIAFGAGVLLVADQKLTRWVGAILMALGAVGFPTHTVWAMSSRGMKTGFNDTMHIAMSVVFSVMVAVAMVLVALKYRGWFRRYSLVTLAVVIGFGMAASMAIRGIKQNDTPWAGGFERIDAYAYLAWLVALVVVEMRRAFSSKGAWVPEKGSEPKPIAA